MDHILRIQIATKGLAEGKNPPICDSCNDSIDPDTDSEGAPIEYYTVNCLILHWHRFWGVLCEECRVKYHSKLPIVDEDAADKKERMGARQELSQEVKVTGHVPESWRDVG